MATRQGFGRMTLMAMCVVLVVGLLLGGCAAQKRAADEEAAGLPNPASVYCEEHDGRLEMRTDADGGQYGVCVFEDGSECEEWAFYRGECEAGSAAGESGALGIANPASVYCEEHDGRLEMRTDADGGQYGVCVFEDGSECEEWAFYREECKAGDSLNP